jgi:DNA polymerase
MNMQNLPRGGELRLSILAPKGHQLVVADSGQIEARVNAWISEQADLLQAFAEQSSDSPTDVYTKFASLIYGREITKADKLERFIGKIGVLGLGYSMGATKLQTTLALGTMGPAVFLELDMCQKIVNLYRRQNFKIVQFWKKCDGIIQDMIAGRSGEYKCLRWETERIWLPNGMCLKYPGIKAKVGENGYTEYSYMRKGIETKIYGGLLCENIVQALSRIIIGDQLLELADRHDYRIVTTTHDELVSCVRTVSASKCFKTMLKVMTTPPAWCSELVLSAEGGWAENYSK